jgi:ADP-ribosylglycohydrolase
MAVAVTHLKKVDQLYGCFLGLILGDAIGIPWKTMHPREIMMYTRGVGVTGFSEPVQTGIKEARNLNAGDFTANWLLTKVVAESLIESQGFSQADFIAGLLTEFELQPELFFDFNRDVLIELKAKVNNEPKPFIYSIESGNDLTKVCPLAINYRQDHEAYWQALMKMSEIFNQGIDTVISAYIYGIALGYVYDHGPINGLSSSQEMLRTLNSCLINRETALGMHPEVNDSQLRKNINIAYRLVDDRKITDLNKVKEQLFPTGNIADDLIFSLTLFLRNSINFKKGILEAVNCGGDCDVNAALVGSLIGINIGQKKLPSDWTNFNEQYKQEAERLAVRLHHKI